MLTDAQLAEMEARHFEEPESRENGEVIDSGGYCDKCLQDWPCDASRAVSDVRELRGLLGEMREALGRWMAWYDMGAAPVKALDGHDGETAAKSRAALARAALSDRGPQE